jgi:beta-lactamase regulating signal transducer with metallopeptidase domain
VATGLAAIVWVLTRFCQRPALAHALWLLVLLKLVTPPLWQFPIVPNHDFAAPIESTSLAETPKIDQFASAPELTSDLIGLDSFSTPSSGTPIIDVPDVQEPSPIVAVEPPTPEIPWRSVIFVVWLAGAVLYLGIAAVRFHRFHRLLRHAAPAPADLQARARQLGQQLGLRRHPSVWMLPGPVAPMLWAFAGRPRVLLPVSLWTTLSEDQRSGLLAHELAHLRRHDHWTRRLELLTTALYWWAPVVWWVRREIAIVEEECCDAWVVWALPQKAREYALALLETVDFLCETRPVLPPAASGIRNVYYLRRRLSMIMRGSTPRALSRASLAILLIGGALVLPFLPTLAQPPSQPAADTTLFNVSDAAPTDDDAPAPTKSSVISAVELEEARNIIELMKIQLEGKRADYQEGVARVKSAKRQLATIEKLGQHASQEDLEKARVTAEVAEAQLGQKNAQVREAEIRLQQAMRRADMLKQLKSAPDGADSKKSVEQLLQQEKDRVRALEAQIREMQAKHAEWLDRAKTQQTTAEAALRDAVMKGHQLETERARAEELTKRASESRGASPSSKEEARLRALEGKLEALSREMKALREELKAVLSKKSREEK